MGKQCQNSVFGLQPGATFSYDKVRPKVGVIFPHIHMQLRPSAKCCTSLFPKMCTPYSTRQISAKSVHWFTNYFKVTDRHACCTVNFSEDQAVTILVTSDFEPLNM